MDTYRCSFPNLFFGELKVNTVKPIALTSPLEETVTITTSKSNVIDLQRKIGDEANFVFKEMGTTPPWLMSVETQSDAYLLNIDSVFHEDISLLYYGFSINLFGEKNNANQWFDQYMSLETEERVQALKELHQEMLLFGRIIPIGFAPYISVMRSDFDYSNNKDVPGTELWKIRKK